MLECDSFRLEFIYSSHAFLSAHPSQTFLPLLKGSVYVLYFPIYCCLKIKMKARQGVRGWRTLAHFCHTLTMCHHLYVDILLSYCLWNIPSKVLGILLKSYLPLTFLIVLVCLTTMEPPCFSYCEYLGDSFKPVFVTPKNRTFPHSGPCLSWGNPGDNRQSPVPSEASRYNWLSSLFPHLQGLATPLFKDNLENWDSDEWDNCLCVNYTHFYTAIAKSQGVWFKTKK